MATPDDNIRAEIERGARPSASPLPLGWGVSTDLKEGAKFDTHKRGWHLLPYDALEGIVEILDMGAVKYAPRNWEKGMDWSRVYGALLRHLTDWFLRRGVDKDSGKSHLWHAGCCILFLIAYEMREVGKDDRPGL